MSVRNYLSFSVFATLITQNFPNSSSHENEVLSLTWCISDSLDRVLEVKASKCKSWNIYSETNYIQTMTCQTGILFGSSSIRGQQNKSERESANVASCKMAITQKLPFI